MNQDALDTPRLIAAVALAENLDLEEARARVLRDPQAASAEIEKISWRYLRTGTLSAIPAKWRPRVFVMIQLSRYFAPGRQYSEAEVNEILRPFHSDVAFLRRQLVDLGLLCRSNTGHAMIYWLGALVQAKTETDTV